MHVLTGRRGPVLKRPAPSSSCTIRKPSPQNLQVTSWRLTLSTPSPCFPALSCFPILPVLLGSTLQQVGSGLCTLQSHLCFLGH